MRAIRFQDDDQGDHYSVLTGLDCSTGSPDQARQEFKDETDINVMMARVGAVAPVRPPIYGEVDYDLDLQQALSAIADAQFAWSKTSAESRAKYPTWQSLLNAVNSGEYDVPARPGVDPRVDPPVEPAASTSSTT